MVTCESEEHRLLVEDGRIRLVQHDLERELAVFLLGSDPCACLAAGLYLEWISHSDLDDRSLVGQNEEPWRVSGAFYRYLRSSGFGEGVGIARRADRAWLGKHLHLEGR